MHQETSGTRDNGRRGTIVSRGLNPGRSLRVIDRWTLSCATVELRENIYHHSAGEQFKVDRGMLELSLSGRPATGEVHFLDESRRVGGPVGDLVYLPAAYSFDTLWQPGSELSLNCQFSGDRPDCSRDWTEEQLRASLSIQSPIIIDLMFRLHAEIQSPGPFSDVMMEGICLQIAGTLGRYFDEFKQSSGRYSRLSQQKLREVLDALDGRRGMPTLQEIARDFGYSPRHFSRIFLDQTGRRFSDYVMERRLSLAKQMLTGSALNIKEIAFELGFDAAADFSRAFRRNTGSSPRTFRHASGRRLH